MRPLSRGGHSVLQQLEFSQHHLLTSRSKSIIPPITLSETAIMTCRWPKLSQHNNKMVNAPLLWPVGRANLRNLWSNTLIYWINNPIIVQAARVDLARPGALWQTAFGVINHWPCLTAEVLATDPISRRAQLWVQKLDQIPG